MDTLKRIFTSSTFWLLNAIINSVISIISLFNGSGSLLPILSMWISLAAFDIIKNQEKLLSLK